jgi:hypothetical protein
MLKKEDPRVIRSVLYYMKWVPKLEYKKNKCPKKIINSREDPTLDILLDMADFPKQHRRKK